MYTVYRDVLFHIRFRVCTFENGRPGYASYSDPATKAENPAMAA
jgi:hypothetical protein